MNTTQVLSTPEMATAIAEGIQKGFVDALSQGYREPREWICDAIRLGVKEAITDFLDGYSVLDALKPVGERRR
jgi:hypothetical protein